jgi:hypothetical protein
LFRLKGKVSGSLVTFSYMLSTVSPLPLAVLRESPLISLFIIMTIIPVLMLVYYAINISWDVGGLFTVSSLFNRTAGRIQLLMWTLSYSLYVVYTSFFISFYLLHMGLNLGILISFFIFAAASALTFLNLSPFAFIVLAFFQILLIIPLGWKINISFVQQPLQDLFVNVLNSSLLLVCITLVPYWKGEKKNSRLIFIALAVASAALLAGGFFIPPDLIVEASSIGYFSLILAEYRAIRDLYRFKLQKKRSDVIIFSCMLLGMLIGSADVWKFYYIASGISIILLYPALFISFLSVWRLKKDKTTALFFALSGILLLYAEYSAITFYLA